MAVCDYCKNEPCTSNKPCEWTEYKKQIGEKKDVRTK